MTTGLSIKTLAEALREATILACDDTVWTEGDSKRIERAGRQSRVFLRALVDKSAKVRELEAQAARPEIALFARLMEIRMARHDGDWGDTWKLTPVPDVLEQIEYALGELRGARWGNSTLRMAEKAADVANFAMMAAFAMSDVEAVVAALTARKNK